MINQLDIKKYIAKYKYIYYFYTSENIILEKGLLDYYKLIISHIPIILAIILLVISYFLDTNLNNYLKNLISILPSLIGFLIASATILITVNSEKIDATYEDTSYTFREIGGSIFFYATKIAILLLVVSFISVDHLEKLLNCYVYNIISFIVILYFSKMIIAILYGLMFLTSVIKSIKV